MVLNERKIKILEAIITDYIQTAEPIGSRTIAKKYDLGISSATIRNEMSDLEDMGFIIQPHASAGRVPSDKGYRLYVDRLMQYKELSQEESEFLQKMIRNNINQIDYLMKETAKAIALLTNYTTIVSEPKSKGAHVGQIQLMPYDEKHILLIMVTDSKAIKNHVFGVEKAPSYDRLNQLSQILNNSIKDLSLDEMDIPFVDGLIRAFGDDRDILHSILNEIVRTLQFEGDKAFYTSGVKNILGYPEFSNLEKAKALFQTLEEKDLLITMLDQDTQNNIQIVIGSENSLVQLKDCSIIKANYMLSGESYGSIGIIGPTRMDYTQAVSVLNGIIRNLDLVIKALDGG